MSDEFKYDRFLENQDPTILQGQMIVNDIHDHSYDQDRYKNIEDATSAATDEMQEGYIRRLEYLKSYNEKNDNSLNVLFHKNMNAQVPSVPNAIRKKVSGIPAQRAAASKSGLGKVKEKYRVFKRSFKNTNATAVTVRESDKLKAYKKNQDEFDKNFAAARENMQISPAYDLEIDALKYFVDREETTTEKAKTDQIAVNKKKIEDYFKDKDCQNKTLNNALKELINFEMTEAMFTDAYLSANITNMVEMTYKFRAFKDLYNCNENYFRDKKGIIEKLVFSRGKILEDFVTGHLRQQGLQIDWATKTTTTINDKTKKTDAQKTQDRDNLVKTTIESVNKLKADSRQEYVKMLASTVKVDKNYVADVDRKYESLVKKVAQNPGVYHSNKDLLRRLAGKAGRYAAILSELEAQVDAYETAVEGENDDSLNDVLSKNAASTIVENLRKTYGKYEDQYRAYELTILSIVDSKRQFNAEESFLIKDTIENEKIDQSITELRVRKDYHEAHFRSIGEDSFVYGQSRGEQHRQAFVEGLRNQDKFIKDYLENSYDINELQEHTANLNKNNEIDPALTKKYKPDSLFQYAAPMFNKFLGPQGDESAIGKYNYLKSLVDNYDHIVKNDLLRGKPQEIYENVTVNGKMAKYLLKGWEPLMHMYNTGIHFNLPLDKDGEPLILLMGQNELNKLIGQIEKTRRLNGELPEHMDKYMKLARLQLEKVKINDNLSEKYKGSLKANLVNHHDFLSVDAEINYLTHSLHEKKADNVGPDMIRITRVATREMETDDLLPANVKEGLGLQVFLAIKPMLNKGALDFSGRKYDAKGNLENEFSVRDQEKYEENMHIANLFRTLWNEPSSLSEEDKEEINKLVADYYKYSFTEFDEEAYKIGINGNSNEKNLGKKIESEARNLDKAMSKNASAKLIQKMIEAGGVGFGKLDPTEYSALMKDAAENKKTMETLDTYLIQNGYDADFKLHTGD